MAHDQGIPATGGSIAVTEPPVHQPSPRSAAITDQRLAVLADKAVVMEWWNATPFNDEPKYWHLCARLSVPDSIADSAEIDDTDSVAGASSMSFEHARLRLAGECVERFVLGSLDVTEHGPALTFAAVGRRSAALSRHDVVCGAGLYPSESAVVRWVDGIDLVTRRPLAVPAQLVHVPYVFDETESVLRAPISTGAAAHTDLDSALLNGLLECIERDAFTYAWCRQSILAEFEPEQLANAGGEAVRRRLDACRRYRLRPRCFLLPTDVEAVTVVMVVLCDTTGVGPSVCVGAKASMSLLASMVGALDETHQIRSWMRRLQSNGEPPAEPPLDRLHDRALYWLQPGPARELLDWLDRSTRRDVAAEQPSGAGLADVCASVASVAGTVAAVDLTSRLPRDVARSGWHVVKVVCPGLQPMSLSDSFPDLVPGRLLASRADTPECADLDMLHTAPHPFM